MSSAGRRRIAPSAAAFVGRGQDGTLCFDLPFGWLLVWLDSVTGLAKPGLHGLVLSPASLAAFVSRLFVNWFMFDGAIWRKGDKASPLLQSSSPHLLLPSASNLYLRATPAGPHDKACAAG